MTELLTMLMLIHLLLITSLGFGLANHDESLVFKLPDFFSSEVSGLE